MVSDFFILYMMLGAGAGFLAGLLGVGGGLIIVPVLAWSFAAQGFPSAQIMHYALGTSLASIVATSLASAHAHHRHGAVDWHLVRRFTAGLMSGALAGAFIADALSSQFLQRLFAIFALLVAVQLAWGRSPPPERVLPGAMALSGVAMVIGVVSALVGIGGGSMTVPLLVWCNVAVRRAVATSAAAGFPIAVAGMAGSMLAGADQSDAPGSSIGYVYLPALLAVALFSVLTAPLGARVAHRVSAKVLKRVFALFLALLGLNMLWGWT